MAMHYHIEIRPKTLYFKKPAGTSRGTYTERMSWYIYLTAEETPGRQGIGECAPLPKLSCDDVPGYEEVLAKACQNFTRTGRIDVDGLRDYPSILFGLETAFRHFEAGSFALWNTPFSHGEVGIPINGLIWMGSYEDMLGQVTDKIESGFRCIKLKIGAIDFDKELEILRIIRKQFSSDEIELRVDANGAFSPNEAMRKLNRLAKLDLHSIEQPIRAGQWEDMALLAASSPVPIALDEELIGYNTPEKKKELLSFINPQYIILKPSLHGGLYGCSEWIKEAQDRQIGWGITSALVTTTFVFMAVFIPVSFMGGTTGTFYTQFGLTMAVAVAISLVNALTLSPALCALIMTPHEVAADGKKMSFSSRFHIAFDSAFHRLVQKYKTGVFFMLKRKWLALVLLLVAFGGLFILMKTTKTGLVPQEDMGTIFVDVRTSPGNTLEETKVIMDEVDRRISDIPQIRMFSKVTGNGMISGQGSSNGMFIVRLKQWDERQEKEDEINAVIDEIYRRTDDISSAQIMAFAQPMIPGYGVSSGFEIYVQDQKGGSVEDLLKYTRQMIEKLNARPEIGRATTSFDTKFPQYMVEVDAARCKRNGVSPSDVLSTLSGYIGGNYASNMNRFSKLYRVMVQASPEFRLDTEALNNMFVRNSDGEMSPISQYLTLTRVYGSETLTRFNLFSAISVNGAPATGYSSGQAIQAVREVAEETLPAGYGFEFGGMSREESSTGNTAVLVFVICVVFIYLILCALYESLFIPLAVILSVPFGLAGSFLFAKMFGLENNIYLQTGVIMLIGLLAKTAILLTEYASERRHQGMSITQAAVSAAEVRLRPILMTSLTMIFGMLPLMFASGVGANGNISIGVGTVGGMLIGTIALLFIVPVLFIVFQYLQEKIMPQRKVSKLEEEN